MKCSKCGNELPDNALFCDNCGQKTQDNELRKSFCGNCGAELEMGMEFCGECGHSVKIGHDNKEIADKPTKNKSGLVIVVIVIISLCIAILATIVGYMIYSSNNDTDTDANIAISTATPKAQPTITPIPTNTPLTSDNPASGTTGDAPGTNSTTISNRADLYNPSLTYNRMEEIHNTVLTNDDTFNKLKSIIIEFNNQCADYMNEITDEVPSYLRYGTTAYSQQVEYKQKHPTLNQSYQKIDVVNARQGGGYYYVWVTEVLNVNENGTAKTSTDHWVYKIENENGQWYICDYTADPAF